MSDKSDRYLKACKKMHREWKWTCESARDSGARARQAYIAYMHLTESDPLYRALWAYSEALERIRIEMVRWREAAGASRIGASWAMEERDRTRSEIDSCDFKAYLTKKKLDAANDRIAELENLRLTVGETELVSAAENLVRECNEAEVCPFCGSNAIYGSGEHDPDCLSWKLSNALNVSKK